MTEETVGMTTAVTATDDADNMDSGATEPQTDDETEGEGETPEAEGDESDGEDTAAKPRKQNWAQKRINELTKARREAERNADYWRRVATGEVQHKDTKPAEKPSGPPRAQDFGQDYQGYIAAVAQHEVQNARIQAEQQVKQAEQERRQQETLSSFLNADEAYAEANPDYRGAQELGDDPTFPINQPMLDAIVETENGPALLHYLDTNRDEAASIAQMSPARAAVALGRIEARLEQPAPKSRPVTKAPPPPPTAKPKAKVAKDPSDMSMDEYVAWRRKQTHS